MKELIVFGGGGHTIVVIDAIEKLCEYTIVGIIDPGRSVGDNVFGYPVLGDDSSVVNLHQERPEVLGFIGIGNNKLREACVNGIRKHIPGFRFTTIVHPAATIGRQVTLGEGTFVAGGATVNSVTTIGRHAIINTNASVDHDCRVGDFAHVAPNAALAGGVTFGDRSMAGLCCGVIEGLSVGADVMVAAGAMVIDNLRDGARVAGVPARPMTLDVN